MTKRNLIFIGALTISYLLMVAFLSYQYPEQVNNLIPVTFGIVLVGVAAIGCYSAKVQARKKVFSGHLRFYLLATLSPLPPG